MYNKKVLSTAKKELNKAKAPKKPKDMITDRMGQWKYPGLDTRIPGDGSKDINITMDGVYKPLLAIADTGEKKKLYPGDNHTFRGAKYVDEFPEAKRGGNKKRKTKSLSGTNKLMQKNPLLRDYKNREFDPNVDYFQKGGMKTVKSKDGTVTNILEKKDGSKIMQVKTKDGKYYEKELKDWEYDKNLLGKSKDISINPQKWGLNDYSDYSSYNSAFRNARESNEDEFTYKGERYNTKLIPKKDSDLYWEGKEFVKDYYRNQPYTRKIDSDLNYFDIENNYFKNKYKTTWHDLFEKQKKLENKLGSFEKAINDPEWIKLDDLLMQISHEEDAIRENENADYTNYLNKIKEEEAANQRNQRLNDLDKPSYFSITNQKPKDMRADGYWDKGKNKTFMRTNTEPGKLNTTYVHELSHKADDIMDVMNTVPKIDLKKLNASPFSKQMSQETYEYVSDPSEIEARKLSTLYFLKKHKIPWKSGQINENTVNKLYDYYGDDKLPYDIEQLLQLYSGQQDDFVKYLNGDYTYETKYNFQDGGPKTHKSKDGTVTNTFINAKGDKVIQVKTKDGKYHEKVIPRNQHFDTLGKLQSAINGPLVNRSEPTLEERVDYNLGHPQRKASNMGRHHAEKGEDPIDNIRHPFAGRYTAEALYKMRKKDTPWAPDWMNKGAAWLDANMLGIGHEAGTIFRDERPWSIKAREAAEDIYNNGVGINTGLSDKTSRQKTDYLLNKAYNFELPDGRGEEHPFRNKWVDPYDKKEDGGSINLELTEDEIDQYVKGGYIVEDISVPKLNQAQEGIIQISDPKEFAYREKKYNDSLNAYNYGQKKLEKRNQINKKYNIKENPANKWPASDKNTLVQKMVQKRTIYDVAPTDVLFTDGFHSYYGDVNGKKNKDPNLLISMTNKESGIPIHADSQDYKDLTFTVPFYKKPTQKPVLKSKKNEYPVGYQPYSLYGKVLDPERYGYGESNEGKPIQLGQHMEAFGKELQMEKYKKSGKYPWVKQEGGLIEAQNGIFIAPPLPRDRTRSETTQMVSLPARQAIQHIKNKPGADKAKKKEKKEIQKFKKQLWKEYEKLPLSEKVSDRVGAFFVDPAGMTARALTGEQAYLPGMGKGLLNHEDPEVRDKYLKELGYTKGEFDASDLQNMVNPFYWASSLVDNTEKGNYGTAALEALFMGLPKMPKGTISRSNITSGAKMLKNDVKNAGEYLTTKTPLKNAYKYNPWAFKPNPKYYYRMGEGRKFIDDVLETNKIRAYNENSYANLRAAGKISGIRENGKIVLKAKTFPEADTYWSKGVPLDGRYASQNYGDHMIEASDDIPFIHAVNQKTKQIGFWDAPNVNYNATHIKGNYVKPRQSYGYNIEGNIQPSIGTPLEYNPELIKLYEPHWLKGYKEVPKQLPGSPNAVNDVQKAGFNVNFLTRPLTLFTKRVEADDDYEKGGIVADLTPEEIQDYIAQGYTIEELDEPKLNQAQKGGIKTHKSKDGTVTNTITKANGDTVIQVKTKNGKYYEKLIKKSDALDTLSKLQGAVKPEFLALGNAEAETKREEKQAKQKFLKEAWSNYDDWSTSDKVSDRVGAFLNDPFGMTARALTGDQAYIPGMAQGLHNHEDPEVRNRYLKELGYTPGEFDASDVQNMINPGYWASSFVENSRKGNVGTAALEGALMFLPHLPKGTVSKSNIRSGANMLKNDLKQLERNPQSWFQTPEERLNNPELYKSLGESNWKDPLGKLYDFNDTRKINQALRRESKLLNPVRGNAEEVAAVREQLGDQSFNNVLRTVSKNKANRRLRRSNLPIAPIRYPEGNILGGGEGNLYVNQLNPEEIVKIGIKPGKKENLEALVRIGNEMREAGIEGFENVALPRKVIPFGEDPIRRITAAAEFQPWLGNKLNPENPIVRPFSGFRGEGSLDAKNKLVNIVRELDNRGVGIDYPHNNIMYDKASDSYKLVDFNHINESSPAFHFNKTDIPVEQRLKSEGYLTDSEANIFEIMNGKPNAANEWETTTSNLTRPVDAIPYKPELNTNAASKLYKLTHERKLLFDTPEGEKRIQDIIDNTPELKEAGFTVNDYKKGLDEIINVNHHYHNMYKKYDDLEKALNYGMSVPGADLQALNDMNSQLGKMAIELGKYEEFIHKPKWYLNAYLGRNKNKNAFDLVKDPDIYAPHTDDTFEIFASPWLSDDDILRIGRHEIGHYVQRGVKTNLDKELEKITLLESNPAIKQIPAGQEKGSSEFYNKILSKEDPFYSMKKYWKTGSKGQEKVPFMEEVRADLLEEGMINNLYDEVTPEMLEYHYTNYLKKQGNKYPLRIFDIMENKPGNFKIMSDVINKMPAVAPIVGGAGAAAIMGNEQGQKKEMKKGGIVADLTEKEIREYTARGYIVEEDDDEYQDGGEAEAISNIRRRQKEIADLRANSNMSEEVNQTPTQAPVQKTIVINKEPIKPLVRIAVSNKQIEKPKSTVVNKPIVKTFEKSKVKAEQKLNQKQIIHQVQAIKKDLKASYLPNAPKEFYNQFVEKPVTKHVQTPKALHSDNKTYADELKRMMRAIEEDDMMALVSGTEPKPKPLFENSNIEKEILDRQKFDNTHYGRFDTRGDDVMNRTDVKRNRDSELFFANMAKNNSVIVDIGSALGNNNPSMAGVSVWELASNPQIKKKGINVIATDLPDQIKDFKKHVKNKKAYPIDYAEVPETFNTPIADILKSKKLDDKKDVYLRAANSIDLLMNTEQAIEHLNHIAKTLKNKNVTYLYNNVILFKPEGSKTFKKLGNLNNAGFDHNNRTWVKNKNRIPYTLNF